MKMKIKKRGGFGIRKAKCEKRKKTERFSLLGFSDGGNLWRRERGPYYAANPWGRRYVGRPRSGRKRKGGGV